MIILIKLRLSADIDSPQIPLRCIISALLMERRYVPRWLLGALRHVTDNPFFFPTMARNHHGHPH